MPEFKEGDPRSHRRSLLGVAVESNSEPESPQAHSGDDGRAHEGAMKVIPFPCLCDEYVRPRTTTKMEARPRARATDAQYDAEYAEFGGRVDSHSQSEEGLVHDRAGELHIHAAIGGSHRATRRRELAQPRPIRAHHEDLLPVRIRAEIVAG